MRAPQAGLLENTKREISEKMGGLNSQYRGGEIIRRGSKWIDR